MKLYLKYYKSKFDRIILYCPNFYYDPKYNYLDGTNVKLFEEVTDKNLDATWEMIRKDTSKKTLLWMDDCMGQDGMRSNRLARILINARHNNTSVVALVQEIVGVAPVFRRQCDCFFGFQTQDDSDRTMVYKNFGYGKKEDFMEMYDRCTKYKYKFMLMNRQGPTVQYFENFKPVKIKDV